jgi:hypothetical protein
LIVRQYGTADIPEQDAAAPITVQRRKDRPETSGYQRKL